MPDKIAKLLSKIHKADQKRIAVALDKIKRLEFSELDVKRSKTTKNRYRVRVGRYRIIFDLISNKPFLISIDKRNKRTYRNF